MPDTKKAQKVLNLIRDTVLVIPGEDLCVQTYDNGREHGYKVHNFKLAIVFSEYRNTDQIVLYTGRYKEIRESSGISSRMYETKEFFKPSDYNGVVSAGLSFLFGRPR